MRAAEYVRVSTDMQLYSILNQQATIAEYARSHGFEIVKTYADPAKSGLDIRHRPGLQSLINDVVAGNADFRAILVYDVSRWGRFQDLAEAGLRASRLLSHSGSISNVPATSFICQRD